MPTNINTQRLPALEGLREQTKRHREHNDRFASLLKELELRQALRTKRAVRVSTKPRTE